MKRLLLTGLLALTACQGTTPMPVSGSSPTATRSTPRVTTTTTETATPAPTFTSTPVPRYFTEDFNSDLTPWVSFQTGGETTPKINLVNSLLRMDIPSPHTWYYMIHNTHEYEESFISAKFTGTPPGAMGLVCRYKEGEWLEFNIASDGTYTVLYAEWLDEGIAQYTPITSRSSEYLQPGNLTYEIGLTCQEQYLLLHVNGKLFRKIDVSRYGLSGGRIGLSVSSFEETPMIASFDWVRVGEPGQ